MGLCFLPHGSKSYICNIYTVCVILQRNQRLLLAPGSPLRLRIDPSKLIRLPISNVLSWIVDEHVCIYQEHPLRRHIDTCPTWLLQE